ncbi:Mut7-C RNAse domain-containing protein [Microlunatus sp. Gsoil 973]|uniref:Mut7-C RNAse domain-containing protein n=1 Tax=Microlunatus sp. Gsoil 973 TaxID=2672569 RepID=UPI0012B4943B|nr:Mut7-C RNAse domain-containing protein [Microlunatus sp. Gsoil 973]QGN34022.1 hypothetical protein GJV80_15720 [Microlunatus sp. Gsoil 973]
MPTLELRVAQELRFLLPPARRSGTFQVTASDTDTIGHVVQAVGIPLTEVGDLLVDGRVASAEERAVSCVLVINPVVRPQRAPTSPPRFLLDVHLGGLARRLRILGLDVAYRPEADDPVLAEQAADQRRVLLTQDRGLLRRRRVTAGALVRGAGSAAQLHDVLDQFAPPLSPWTRCPQCGAALERVSYEAVVARLQPGTRRSYREFSRCTGCDRVYWRGAHSRRLEPMVEQAEEVVRRRLNANGKS